MTRIWDKIAKEEFWGMFLFPLLAALASVSLTTSQFQPSFLVVPVLITQTMHLVYGVTMFLIAISVFRFNRFSYFTDDIHKKLAALAVYLYVGRSFAFFLAVLEGNHLNLLGSAFGFLLLALAHFLWHRVRAVDYTFISDRGDGI